MSIQNYILALHYVIITSSSVIYLMYITVYATVNIEDTMN